MCEPYHSIVQYPEDGGPPSREDQDRGNDSPTGSHGMSVRERLGKWLGNASARIRQIKGWFHLDKIGGGHSAAVAVERRPAFVGSPLIIPGYTAYENAWWDRSVHLDGRYGGWPHERTEAMMCAEQFAKELVNGSLPNLRHFLELSLQKTAAERRGGYVDAIYERLLSPKGRRQVDKKLVHAIGLQPNLLARTWLWLRDPVRLQAVINTLMGATRKRENLNDRWAMDDKLWVPNHG